MKKIIELDENTEFLEIKRGNTVVRINFSTTDYTQHECLKLTFTTHDNTDRGLFINPINANSFNVQFDTSYVDVGREMNKLKTIVDKGK